MNDLPTIKIHNRHFFHYKNKVENEQNTIHKINQNATYE